jgi:DNA-binding transcriptional MerR regulator
LWKARFEFYARKAYFFSARRFCARFFRLFFFAFVSENTNAEYNNGIKRLYYSITEVSDLVDEEQYALRYWETEFPQLKPQKNRAGNRVYTEHDIKVIRDIQYLLRIKRLTIDAAKEYLVPLYPESSTPPIKAPEDKEKTLATTAAEPAEMDVSSLSADEALSSAVSSAIAPSDAAHTSAEGEELQRGDDIAANGFGFSRAPVAEWNAPFVGQFPATIVVTTLMPEKISPEEAIHEEISPENLSNGLSSEEFSSEELISEKPLSEEPAEQGDSGARSSQSPVVAIARTELLDIRAALLEALRLLTPEQPDEASADKDGE